MTPTFTTENKVIKDILGRTSIREYDPERKVHPEVLEAILRSAMAAPSAVNKQPWSFVVVDDPDILAKLAAALPYAHMAAHAPLAIVVCGDRSRFLEGTDSTLWVQDLSAASENILLAAEALGLGGVWTCIYPHAEREDPVSAILGLPDGIIPFNLIPLGYPTRAHKPKDKWDSSKIHRNKW